MNSKKREGGTAQKRQHSGHKAHERRGTEREGGTAQKRQHSGHKAHERRGTE
ncbi:unnamed protein product, partial [Sphenostylis stenocarpa]